MGSAAAAGGTAAAAGGTNFAPWLLASSLITGVSGLFTAHSQAKAQTLQANSEAITFSQNSELAKMQSKDAIARGEIQAQDYQRQVKKLAGAQRARLAAQGLDLGSGNALDIQMDTARFGALDVATIRENAYREAFGYDTQALNYKNQADMSKLTGKAKANNTLLTGGLQFANTAVQTGYKYNLLQFGR